MPYHQRYAIPRRYAIPPTLRYPTGATLSQNAITPTLRYPKTLCHPTNATLSHRHLTTLSHSSYHTLITLGECVTPSYPPL